MQVGARHSVATCSTTKTLRAVGAIDAPATSHGLLTVHHALTAAQRCLAQRLAAALSDAAAAHAVRECISGAAPFSLRMLDWLVTNYAKRRALRVAAHGGRAVHVHEAYRAALAQYRRRDFDPFRRTVRRYGGGDPIEMHVTAALAGGDALQTTLGQLNFLEWAHRTGVLSYARQHAEDIERDMQGEAAARAAQALPRCQVYDVRCHVQIG